MPGPSLCRLSGGQLEEHLQTELDSPRDVALATGVSEVTVPVIRNPELIHRTEEDTVERVPRIGFEPDILVLAEEGVFVDGYILVEILKAAYTRVLSWRAPELQSTRIGPSCLTQVRVVGSFESP